MTLTAAPRDAIAILAANLAALRPAQPVAPLPPSHTPTLGRDGSPTFLTPAGDWWTACSVPRAASAAMLDSVGGDATVVVFLAPMHPAAMAVALDKLADPNRILLAVIPEDLPLFLACDDFSAPLADGRLRILPSIAAVAALLRAHPGLPLPGMIVRTHHLPPGVAEEMIATLQSTIEAETTLREREITSLRAAPTTSRSRPARRVVATIPGHYRLWDSGRAQLADILHATDLTITPYCPSDPWQMGSGHLLSLTRDADALIAADFYRDDAAGLLDPAFPIITWATTLRLGRPGHPDVLLAARPEIAAEAQRLGWRPDRILLAPRPIPLLSHTTASGVALIADLTGITLPPAVEDLSSHRLCWERIESELAADPFRAGSDIAAYVDRVRASMGIPADGFPLALFTERLALPTWQAALARRLAAAQVGLRLHGHGWSRLADLTPLWHGPLTSRQAFHEALSAAAIIIDPVPAGTVSPGCGRPTASAAHGWASLLRQIRSGGAHDTPANPLSPALIAQALNIAG